jgi:alpha-glutamyl/putrescinyl thymine pyrophosphorylase clade 1
VTTTGINVSSPAAPIPYEVRCSPEFLPLCPTPVFDAFWTFAAERQAIFTNRRLRLDSPWTTDPILNSYKFTNVYRASDRVSQFLIRNVIYSGDHDQCDVILRILLFKLFNKIETWQLLEREVGQITASRFSIDLFDRILSSALECGQRIYSAAYIMPPGSKAFETPKKHVAHLRLLDFMLKDNISVKLVDSQSLQGVFNILHSYPLIGDFLAYQYAIDINYSEIINFPESEFVVAGPGARSGIRKCFANSSAMAEEDIIRLVTELQEQEFALRRIKFQWLGGRRLQLIDIQNIFCEIDKYSRVRFPEIVGAANRVKIKQRFNPHPTPIDYWYPPKWGINEAI